MKNKTYKVIGMMSGSSLDGLDIAYCSFELDKEKSKDQLIKNWTLIYAETIPFSEKWQLRLHELPKQSALVFAQTNTYFAHYMAELLHDFLRRNKIDPDFISSHGHTVFHAPEKRMSIQIGDGAALAALTGLPVINNFRTQDVALDGEGAPIAPIADQMLFQGYDFYMNIGGIANITCNIQGKFIAFDIGPANQVFNLLANQLELSFDEDGQIAKSGHIISSLLNNINTNSYFQKPYPKTLDNNWIQREIFPPYISAEGSWNDKLRTAVEQLAEQTAFAIQNIIKTERINKNEFNVLVSGGGAFNSFLIEKIQEKCDPICKLEIVIPNPAIIDFKEAILMALVGVLRVENIPNCIKTVTGAKRDTIGGSIFQGSRKFI